MGPRFRALEACPILSSLAGQGTHLVLSADGHGGQVCPWPVCQAGTSPEYMGQGHCSGRRPAPLGFPPTSERSGAMLQLEEDTPSVFWMSPARVTVPLTSWVLWNPQWALPRAHSPLIFKASLRVSSWNSNLCASFASFLLKEGCLISQKPAGAF